jgi:hypothetical protein
MNVSKLKKASIGSRTRHHSGVGKLSNGGIKLSTTLPTSPIVSSIFESFVRALARFSAREMPADRIAHSNEFKSFDSKTFDI